MKAFFVGLQFLTRLKLVNQTSWDLPDFGRSVTYFALVGYVIGGFLWGLYALLSPYLELPLLALLLVVAEFLFTGGLHADGFMDTCDGLFSGRDRERKLEIMKDSRVGSNGVVGFVFLVLLKWQLIAHLPLLFIGPILFIMPILSRYSLTMSVTLYPYARKEGMGKAFAMYAPKYAMALGTLFALLPLFYAPIIYLLLFAWTVVINIVLNKYMVKHLGGVTGDTYGFVIESTEILLLFLIVLLPSFLAL